ncbi:helix-hairpin-helix domain-containing protein [Haloarchaeobius litoreus]|uniref:Helix-hairpin-helix domain-containing protein n=1 Tax=Haloarchaeobius litoreus TaxID=755306 RepID=A0ABD6DEF9_9EURY|nr:helix-hairpin-helix domain-containing protein [Haloarchaeobius litoreus]
MALLKKLKSLFGLDDGSQPESSRDVGVTVEKERRAGATAGSATEGDDGGSTTEHTTDETETTDEAAETTDETAETTDQTAEAADETAETADEEESEPVQEVKGIGPAYADRLGTVGIETIADLAEADPEAVAAETDISETRVTEWVKRAKARS